MNISKLITIVGIALINIRVLEMGEWDLYIIGCSLAGWGIIIGFLRNE